MIGTQQPEHHPWSKLSKQGTQALNRHDWATAECCYRQLLKEVPSTDPERPFIKCYLSEALSKQNRWKEANVLDYSLLIQGPFKHKGREDVDNDVLGDVYNDILCRRLERGHELYNQNQIPEAFFELNSALEAGMKVLPNGHPVIERLKKNYEIVENEYDKQNQRRETQKRRQETGSSLGQDMNVLGNDKQGQRNQTEHQGQHLKMPQVNGGNSGRGREGSTGTTVKQLSSGRGRSGK